MEINGAYGGRPTWVTLQGAQVPKIGLCIEVDRIHRRRGGGRVAVGQGSDRKHIRVGGDRACMFWLLHGKNWGVFPDLDRRRGWWVRSAPSGCWRGFLPRFHLAHHFVLTGRRLPTSPSSTHPPHSLHHIPFNPLVTESNPPDWQLSPVSDTASTSRFHFSPQPLRNTQYSLYIYILQSFTQNQPWSDVRMLLYIDSATPGNECDLRSNAFQ